MPRKPKQHEPISQTSLFNGVQAIAEIASKDIEEKTATTTEAKPSGPLADWRKKWSKNGNPIKLSEPEYEYKCPEPISCPDGTINSHPCLLSTLIGPYSPNRKRELGLHFIDDGSQRYRDGKEVMGWHRFCWSCGEYINAGVSCNDL